MATSLSTSEKSEIEASLNEARRMGHHNESLSKDGAPSVSTSQPVHLQHQLPTNEPPEDQRIHPEQVIQTEEQIQGVTMSSGWSRSVGEEGQDGHMEPTSGDVLIFVTRLALIRREIKWTRENHHGITILDSNDSAEDFGTYISKQLSSPAAVPRGGFFHQIKQFIFRLQTKFSLNPNVHEQDQNQPEKVILERSHSRYNRLIYHAVRAQVVDYNNLYDKEQGDLSKQTHIEKSTLEQTLANIVDELLSDGIDWEQIVVLLAFAGAFAVQCFEEGRVNEIDYLISEFNRVVFMKRIDRWMDENGGWVFLILPHRPYYIPVV